ncbi:MAG: hypothetical protein OJF55_000624 [Rhodanobacteraceae bacterium]|nr:MAG: hypothetical protein OJF55_000624 [Rhodanobacteraceae bacterium]
MYYDISGNTAAALRHQLDARGPLGESGKRFDAHTDWRVSWNYRYRTGPSGCEFTALEVSTSGTILLPRWVHAADVPDSLLRKWQAYSAALLAHEQGHYTHATDAAGEITRLEQSFNDYSGDCASLARAFNARADAIVERYKAEDAAYDEATGHGRTQGATFP